TAALRIRGVPGDLRPIVELRWSHSVLLPPQESIHHDVSSRSLDAQTDFPQFLGPNRTAQLDAPELNRDWAAHPPRVLWRQPIGPAWSGWVIVGTRALTQEQRNENECTTCYDAQTGHLLWPHADPSPYGTTIA